MLSPRPPVHSPSGVSASFSRRSLSPAGRPRGGRSSRTPHLARCTLTQTLPRFSTPGRCVPPGRDSLCGLQAERRAPRCVHCSRPGSEFNLTHSVRLPVLIPPPPAPFPWPLPLSSPIRPPAPPPPIPRVPGWGGGEAGTAPRPHGRPSEPEAEGAPGGAGHRPAGPARAGPGPGAGLPWPPAGRGQPGKPGIAVCPGEARLHTPPWADQERTLPSS